ncbi:MAG: hypothetical protein IJ763_09860 [Lachnospiraceae bacterium]|nr:hypothetical protein [Lachnospiraceae bacterium]
MNKKDIIFIFVVIIILFWGLLSDKIFLKKIKKIIAYIIGCLGVILLFSIIRGGLYIIIILATLFYLGFYIYWCSVDKRRQNISFNDIKKYDCLNFIFNVGIVYIMIAIFEMI